MQSPALTVSIEGESLQDQANRLAASADYVAFSDACTASGAHGLGSALRQSSIDSPYLAYCQTSCPALSVYRDNAGVPQPIHINTLEFIAFIIAYATSAAHILSSSPSLIPSPSGRQLHIHLWCDNTAALGWVRKNRASHQLHTYLLRLLCELQIRSNILLTYGHVAGEANVTADTISRDFSTPDGPRVLSSLAEATHVRLDDNFFATLQSVASLKLNDELPPALEPHLVAIQLLRSGV